MMEDDRPKIKRVAKDDEDEGEDEDEAKEQDAAEVLSAFRLMQRRQGAAGEMPPFAECGPNSCVRALIPTELP
ncbi:neutral alpha-glucosidase AB [Pseudozyma hubeiensis SY62]|uniref:Neutral alpha-glucosidase AB n=1 Tax=Pseudozyma hubeiensis (strain SY62) TaxID=1305764 RepID=R9P864_PSEHS|nr:neutral alpha-glucosidase AB [Pseudozyma hubeiensis SY62]GAC97529.1 neutral alpha-glucosidase AB [Pseudozyma hubeiensis SY62]